MWYFFFVGQTTSGEVVNYDPWKVTGDELLDLFAKRGKRGLAGRPQPE